MKLGIIFKKQFQDAYGIKIEIQADEITIKRTQLGEFPPIEVFEITKKSNSNITGFIREYFPIEAIQLIYLGGWNK